MLAATYRKNRSSLMTKAQGMTNDGPAPSLQSLKLPGMLRYGLQALGCQGRTQNHGVTSVPREDPQKDSKHLLVVIGGL